MSSPDSAGISSTEPICYAVLFKIRIRLPRAGHAHFALIIIGPLEPEVKVSEARKQDFAWRLRSPSPQPSPARGGEGAADVGVRPHDFRQFAWVNRHGALILRRVRGMQVFHSRVGVPTVPNTLEPVRNHLIAMAKASDLLQHSL